MTSIDIGPGAAAHIGDSVAPKSEVRCEAGSGAAGGSVLAGGEAAELAALWAHVPLEVRAGWLATARMFAAKQG